MPTKSRQKNDDEKIDITNVSSGYLAECLGMTRDGVTRLARNGVITQNGRARGKYNLVTAVPQYLAHLRETQGQDSTDTSLKKEQTRKLRLQNDKTEAGLVLVTDAAQVFAAYSRVFRQTVMTALPGIAARIAKCDEPGTVTRMFKEDLEDIDRTLDESLLGVLGNET